MSASRFPLLIKQCLLNVRDQAGVNEIVYRGEMRFTYSQFLERVARLGSALDVLGVRQGDVVAIMEWDTHRYLECFFGVPMIGAVLQTVNIRMSKEQILYTLQQTEASVILCNVDFASVLIDILPQLPQVKQIICLTDDGAFAEGLSWTSGYEELLRQGDPGYVFPDFDENSTATTFFTSGTTGLPKRVFYSHRQIVLHTLAELATVALGDCEGHFSRATVYMPITPMFHGHAWGLPYVATMAGCKQVYPGRYYPARLLELYRSEGVTYSHCVPTLLQMMITAPESADMDFSGWKVLIGGGAISSGLIQAAMARGISIITGYGMSETGPMLTMTRLKPEAFSTPEKEIELRVKAGMPIALVDLRVVDAQMQDVPREAGATGEIVARAPWLTEGYWGDPDASEALWQGGYLHTQDIGQLDEHGYLRITDRIKDVIKTGGEWVSSLALEDLISRHPGVSESAVIGVPDPVWSERPMALVVLKAGCDATGETIRAHLKAFADQGDISKYAVPDRVLIVDALDRTSVGKIDKKTLRSRYASR